MKRSYSRLVHLFFYSLCIFILISVCTMPITIGEKFINSFAWIYFILSYAYFFDENPPRVFRVENLYGTDKEEKYRDYMNELIGISQHSLSLMRKIQLHEDYSTVNKSIIELNERYVELKQLNPPRFYLEKHHAVLEDIKGFLTSLSDGDYHLVSNKTEL